MSLGIEAIGVYIPGGREDNLSRQEKFGLKGGFLGEKIGVFKKAFRDRYDDCSDLCVKAFNALQLKTGVDKNEIEVIIVVTQNPDTRLPHAGALVHSKLNLLSTCASFDVSLGCSGFVYGLSVISSFMKDNGFKKGILFTSDPYSKIIDSEDRNTALLFGDGATATLISDNPVLVPGIFSFGTLGSKAGEICLINGKLFMNGQAVVKFVKRYIPEDIRNNIAENGLSIDQIDRFILHQESKFIVDIITEDLGVDRSKVPFDIWEYGNTVSSSIPIILEKEMMIDENSIFLLSGFGVGLSWASCVLKRT
ncbi:MAG TPA: ketoacyl-ACP synthase III [bacterium]|nr:ketoacyl-ACP synthase III [bacterium]